MRGLFFQVQADFLRFYNLQGTCPGLGHFCSMASSLICSRVRRPGVFFPVAICQGSPFRVSAVVASVEQGWDHFAGDWVPWCWSIGFSWVVGGFFSGHSDVRCPILLQFQQVGRLPATMIGSFSSPTTRKPGIFM